MVHVPTLSTAPVEKPVQLPSPSNQTSLMLNIPSTMKHLPVNALIEATMVGVDQRGNILLNTQAGQWMLQSLVPLPTGVRLLFQVLNTGEAFRAKLINIGGREVDKEFLQTLKRGLPDNVKPTIYEQFSRMHGSKEDRSATFVPKADVGIEAKQTLISGKMVQVELVDKSLSALKGEFSNIPKSIVSDNVQAMMQSQSSEQSHAKKRGLILKLRYVPDKIVSKQEGFFIKAYPTKDIPLVQSNIGGLKFPFALENDPKTPMWFQVVELSLKEQSSYLQSRPEKERSDSVQQMMNQWKSVEALSQAIDQQPKELRSKVLQFFPNLEKNFASQWLSLIENIRFKTLLDMRFIHLKEQLEDPKIKQLIDQLHKDMQTFKEVVQPTNVRQVPGNWQMLAVPFSANETLSWMRMYWRYSGQKKATRSRQNDESTRFLIELELESTGMLQCDGFVKVMGKSKQFHLVLRSQTRLPVDLKLGIQEIFANAKDIAGMFGYVEFQDWRLPALQLLQEERGKATSYDTMDITI